MREIGAPVPAVLLIEVEQLAGDLVADSTDSLRTASLDGETEIVLAEDVGVVRAHAATDARAVRTGGDADGRRAEVRDVESGSVKIRGLIGRNVSIYRTASKPRSFNFMLGDRSEVGLI